MSRWFPHRAYAHVTTISVTILKRLCMFLGFFWFFLLTSLGRKIQIADNAENMLCINVACHSNGVFFFTWLLFGNPGIVQCVIFFSSWRADVHTFLPNSRRWHCLFLRFCLGILSFFFCEGNMYIVQIKKCSNVMTNKSERKDGLPQKQKQKAVFILCGFYITWSSVAGFISDKTLHNLRELAE